MRDNIITAIYNEEGRYHTTPVYQYDYGQVLQITGVELPSAYEVHFSNSVHCNASVHIGDSNGVAIPDVYFQSGRTVYAWLFLHSGDDDGETEFLITIPVIRRAKPADYEITPSDQSAISEAVERLNSATAEMKAQRHMGDYRIARATLAASYPVISGQLPVRPLITWNGTYQLIDKAGKVLDSFTNNTMQQPYILGSNCFGVVYWNTQNSAQGKVQVAATMPSGDQYYPLGWMDGYDISMPNTWIGIKHTNT